MKKLPSPAIVAKVLTILILLTFLLSVGYALRSYNGKNAMIAEIYQNGVLIKTIPLSTVTKPYHFTIEGENGATNTIQVTPDGIGMISASCPDQICVRQGFRKDGTLPITCLPNHLVIRLLPSNDEPDAYDAMTY